MQHPVHLDEPWATGPSRRTFHPRFHWLFALIALVLPLSASRGALADPSPMSPAEIIDLARPAVGHGYHWAHGNWTRDGSNVGTCTPNAGSTGCGACSYSGDFGADCSGFVAKVWQVPDPSPVEIDVHPYGTTFFNSSELHWTNLPADRSDVQRGDAFVKDGHIVLVDQHVAGNTYVIYHASGCNRGIRHETWTASSAFKPIRRNELETEACTPSDCSNHGDCNADGTCHCHAGYAGDACDECAEGFSGYPSCAQSGCGSFEGELRCGTEFTLRVQGSAGNVFEGYSCGKSGMAAEEVALTFNPIGVGTATISLTSSDDVSMMLLRNECEPSSDCIDSSTDELSFAFGGNDPYFVVLDAPSPVSSDVTLRVDCEIPRSTWIGDACSSDADCPNGFTSIGAQTTLPGFCYRGPSGSFCSMECTGSCPDLANAAPTGCLEDPQDSSRGICAAQAHALNQDCRRVPGTRSEERARFRVGGNRQFCVPVADADACQGSFFGRVVDASTGEAIEGASVGYETDIGSELSVTDAAGDFSSVSVACGNQVLQISAAGYVPAQVGVDVAAEDTGVPLILMQLEAQVCVPTTAAVSGRVVDGNTDAPVAGANVELRAGLNVEAGAAEATTVSGADGSYTFGGLVAGDYTLSAQSDGFSVGTRRSFSVCETTTLTGEDLFLTPEVDGELRFVLNWNRPADLDLHLLLPNGDDVFYDDPCRGSTQDPPFARLDVDHQDADGPETITLTRFNPGRYELFVHNFSAQNEDAPEGFAESAAEVTVYDQTNRAIRRFAVPSSGSGFFWNVASIEGGSGAPQIDAVQSLTSGRRNPYDEYAGLCNPL